LYLPWKSAVVTNSYIWTISGIVSRSLAILAEEILAVKWGEKEKNKFQLKI